MKRITFTIENEDLTYRGLKTQTRRLEKTPKPRCKLGDVLAVVRPGDGKPAFLRKAETARCHVRVIAVRREPLQAMSIEDAHAECCSSIGVYAALWDSISGKGYWKENPEVTVYTYQVVWRAGE